VDSTDDRNMMNVMFNPEIRNGSNGTAGLVVATKARAVGPVESGTVAQ
jgi:hypothetical protein